MNNGPIRSLRSAGPNASKGISLPPSGRAYQLFMFPLDGAMYEPYVPRSKCGVQENGRGKRRYPRGKMSMKFERIFHEDR